MLRQAVNTICKMKLPICKIYDGLLISLVYIEVNSKRYPLLLTKLNLNLVSLKDCSLRGSPFYVDLIDLVMSDGQCFATKGGLCA